MRKANANKLVKTKTLSYLNKIFWLNFSYIEITYLRLQHNLTLVAYKSTSGKMYVARSLATSANKFLICFKNKDANLAA